MAALNRNALLDDDAEVTDEMLDAGLEALVESDFRLERDAEMVERIFVAMERARRRN